MATSTPAAHRPATSQRGVPLLLGALVGVSLAAGVGFWPSYYSRLWTGVDVYTHVHGLLMTLWCLLLVSQAALVRTRRVARHRALGRVAWVLGPAIVVATLLLAHHRLRVAFSPAQVELLFVQLGTLVLFALAWLLGMLARRQPALHARLMIAGAVTLLDPIFARLVMFYAPGAALLSTYFVPLLALPLLLVLAWSDRRRAGRERHVFSAAAALLAAYQAGLMLVAPGSWWASLATLFLALPLT